MDHTPIRKEIIDKYFDGNVQEFEEMLATGETLEEIADQNRKAMSWKNIELNARCYPEHHEMAMRVIRSYLGYVPPIEITTEFEATLQSLIANYNGGNISKEDFYKLGVSHIKHMRNKDIYKHHWDSDAKMSEADFKRYETHLPAYKHLARERLERFVRDPVLEYSHGIEVHLRQLFQSDQFHRDSPPHLFEYRAVSIYMYRKFLFEFGRQAANGSPLLGIQLILRSGKKPYPLNMK